MGQMQAPSSWTVVTLVFCENQMRNQRKGSDHGVDTVMSKWHASCIVLPSGKERDPESWKKLHMAGVEGISCQHFQVIMTKLLREHCKSEGSKTNAETW